METPFLELEYFGNTLSNWALAVLVFVSLAVTLKVVRRMALKKVSAVAGLTLTIVDDLVVQFLRATKGYFILAIAFFCATLFLKIPESSAEVIGKGVMLVILLQAGIWGTGLIEFWIERHLKKKAAVDMAVATTMGLLSFMVKLCLFIILVLLALNNLGINITALVAGLGVGGIAIALAVQNILGDLFASATIVLDKPFVVGDFVIVGEFMGTIEHIGLKTTRLRSLSGEQLIFPNSNLLQSRIRNFKRMQERRAVFSVGLVYQTSHEKMKRVPDLIREIIQAQPKTRFDRCHFKTFGAFSLDVEAVYWITDPDHRAYMDIQQAINLELLKRFADEGLEFAYPTQTVFMQAVRSDGGQKEQQAALTS